MLEFEKAEELYRKCIECAPDHADAMGNLANLLVEQQRGGGTKEAHALYKRAVACSPSNADNLGNYADFLADVLKDVDGATRMYKKALEANQQHVINLHNYAAFLLKARHDHSAAEKLLKRALKASRAKDNKEDADSLSLYALLIHNYKEEGRWPEAEELHKRACKSPAVRATHLLRYADFLEATAGGGARTKSTIESLRSRAEKLRSRKKGF